MKYKFDKFKLFRSNMSRAESKEKKLALLELIKERKNVLFGSFRSNAIEKNDKIIAWKVILQKAQSLGLATANRDWTYARDHIFGLWKSRTLSKRDKAKRTGNGGEKNIKLDSIDETILDILVTDSPVVEGLRLPEADGISEVSILAEEPFNRNASKISSVGNNKLIEQNKRKLDSDSIGLLKKQVLESELYKNKLVILKLERELGISPSKFTKEIN